MLKVLMLKKQIDNARKSLDALREMSADFEKREADLTLAIDEVTTEEERSAVEEEIGQFESDKKNHLDALGKLERDIEALEVELAEEEAKQNTEPAEAVEERKEEVKEMKTRNAIVNRMSMQERTALVENVEVREYLANVRTAIKEHRALTNVGVTIPTVMLGLLRENVIEYSKLYKHVYVRQIQGEGRQLIMGTIPEAVWTECCANLNELSLGFYDLEMDCYKVAGYFAICNANIEDADIDLIGELLTALAQAIGRALDKAILYGRNATTTQNMPLGVVSRLAQTAAPSGYPATARPWVDLHTTNILALGTAQTPLTGIDLFKAIANGSGAMKGKYSRGEKVWVMNETTYTKLVAEAMSIDASGAIASGVNGTMPVIGGVIEVLDFVPDNVVVGGYFDLYTLAERRGNQFATSEHVRFLQDQTVLKGTARYDGAPAIAEAFVALGIAGNTPAATGVTFASDTANEA